MQRERERERERERIKLSLKKVVLVRRERERERMADSGGRRIGVAVDFSECSKKALNWAIDNVVRDGDYLILITVAPNMNYEEGEMQLWETVGSRTLSYYIPPYTLSLDHASKPFSV